MFRIFMLLLVFAVCSSAGTKLRIITCMLKPQFEFFEWKVIAPWAQEQALPVEVINVPDMRELEGVLLKNRDAALCMLPFGKAWAFVDKKLVQPVSPHLSRAQLRVFETEYILTWLGCRDGVQYFLPHKYETRIMVFRKSKVAEAVEMWNSDTAMRETVVAAVRQVNGIGLPNDYHLEDSPEEWDFIDVCVAGLIWKEMSGAKKEGRIGHRAKQYSGTALRVIDRVYQCGGDSLTMLAMNGDPVIDALTWEAVYAALGVYNSEMFRNRWVGSDLWKAFERESVYLSFLTQVDCFFLHGNGGGQVPGHLSTPQDLGFATMPQGCSIGYKPDSTVLRTGSKSITNGGWWWAIPSGCSDAGLSFKLFEHITSREIQFRECTTFGMIPVRNDVLKSDRLLTAQGWISEMYRVSYRQIKINNNNVIPAQGEFSLISALYLDAWKMIVADGKWSQKRNSMPDRSYISTIIGERFVGRANAVFEKYR